MAKVGRLVKDLIVQELSVALKNRSSFFVTSLSGLEATEADTLRKKLRTTQTRVLMIKRRLGMRGVSATGADGGVSELFQGPVAIVIPGEDIIPAAKLLVDFAKANDQKLKIRGGWVDGQLLSEQRLKEFANLPAKPQLIAEVIGALEAPLVDVIFTLERVLGDVPWVLEEASKTRPQTAESTPKAEESQANKQEEGSSNAG